MILKTRLCTAGLLTVAAALSAIPAVAAANVRYVGSTAQHRSVIVIASKKRVTTENLQYVAKCTGGTHDEFKGLWGMNVDYVNRPRLWTLHNGHFDGTYEDTRDTAQRSFNFAGTIGAKKAHGTFRLKVVNGSETCDTGTVKWSAKPKKVRY
jgi:hypothetical protein